MEASLSSVQTHDLGLAEAKRIIKTCVHYGFCTNTCPTYVLLRDENDSPRGRIDLMRDMLDKGGPPDPKTVGHLDRCLSCLSCMTTCAAQVDYIHLIDRARAYIEAHYRRPFGDRLFRRIIAATLPYPARLYALTKLEPLGRRFAPFLGERLRSIAALSPKVYAPPLLSRRRAVHSAAGKRRHRVVLLTGCVQRVMGNHINDATIRLLNRHNVEVVALPRARCCGALTIHMGKEGNGKEAAWETISAVIEEDRCEPIDAIIVNASGCGTTVKDYGHLFAHDPDRADSAAKVGQLAVDVTEFMALASVGMKEPSRALPYAVAYHDACSLQHAQKVIHQPRQLLKSAGFIVRDVAERHFCCGSAGTYNMLQPKLAKELGRRKAKNVEATGAEIVAAGNLGCMAQISLYSHLPTVHTVELLDWATGGPRPPALEGCTMTPVERLDAGTGRSAAPAEAGEMFW